MQPNEFAAGPAQDIVVYLSDDTGSEVDPFNLYREIAADAAIRAARGQRIVSVASVPLRHSQAYMGREGSGYETKVAVAVVYATA
jgi:hypothetical protein